MNYPVGNDQAYLVVDTTQRPDPSIVILRATDATPIFWSQERSSLESNLDAGGNPRSAMQMLATDPPLVLVGAKIIVWARAAAPTFMSCEIIEQRNEVVAVPQKSRTRVGYPGSSPASNPDRRSSIKLPGFEISWSRKAGVQ